MRREKGGTRTEVKGGTVDWRRMLPSWQQERELEGVGREREKIF